MHRTISVDDLPLKEPLKFPSNMKRVLVVGSARESAGGVSEVIRTMSHMPVWRQYGCRWLGTQIQRNYLWKLWYALKANVIALFIIWRYGIVHFHTVPDRNGLLIQLPILLMAWAGRKRIVMHVHMGNQLANHTHNSLFKWCLRRAHCIVLLAPKWRRMFEELYADIPTPVTVVYNAVETVPEVKTEEKRPVIMMAAYLNDNKAPDLLLKAWKKLEMKYPQWKVEILGNGEVERFRKMAEEMGLKDRVDFKGYVTGMEKEALFRETSIYCMCSYEEGFPMVVLEAWMHGMVLVTTPVGGLPDVLKEGCNALTFAFGDADSLAERLERLIMDENLRKQMAGFSRHFAVQHFSTEEISRCWERIYNEINQV